MALQIGGVIGGQGGSYFSYYGGTDGRVMRKIKVWAATNRIKAISVWLSDDKEKTFGNATKPDGEGNLKSSEFTFNTGESVRRLSLWGNGEGTRSGWIFFETSQGRTFDFGMYKWGKKTEYRQNVQSGIWVGIVGRSSADLDALGVVFLKPIQSCKLINVSYPTLQFSGSSDGSTTINRITSSTKSFKLLNTADEDQSTQLTWELNDDPHIDNVSRSWSISNPSAGLLQFITTSSISMQARTPALSVVNNVVGWKLSDSNTQSPTLSSSSSLSLAWSRTGSVLPSGLADLTANTYRGDVNNLSFTGSAQVTTNSNNTFSYSGLQGQFSGQTYVPALV